MTNRPYLPGHSIQLIHSGDEYFALLEKLINEAAQKIHLHVYIFDNDTTGNKILNALINAVKRDVEVFLLIDGYGSHSLSNEYLQNIKDSGIKFRVFSPLPLPGITLVGRRAHQKVAVIDAKKSLVGGINISNKYSGYGNQIAWFDYALLVEGSICLQLEIICTKIFNRRFYKYPKEILKTIDKQDPVLVRLSLNDWFRRKNEISAGYKQMLREAKYEIIIVASYFTPSPRLLKIILSAAKRKRNVKIILSRNSDVFLMKRSMHYLYSKMLKAGIQIFEYHESILHAKVCVVDKEWSTIGSHNLNKLSEFISIELNLDVKDKVFSGDFVKELDIIMHDKCDEITMEKFHLNQSIFSNALNKIAFLIITSMMQLLYLINRKEGTKKRG